MGNSHQITKFGHSKLVNNSINLNLFFVNSVVLVRQDCNYTVVSRVNVFYENYENKNKQNKQKVRE